MEAGAETCFLVLLCDFRVLEELVGPLTVTVNQDLEDGSIGKLDYILRYKEIVTMVRSPHALH